jgi:hypothetical protein
VNPLSAAVRLAAAVVHEAVAEYRRLDAPPPPPPEPARAEQNCTSASTERRGTYDVRQPAAGRVCGFGKDSGR